MSDNVMRDIITRTNGEIYIGVVGAVRSGKSTFIKRFMETKVLPYVQDNNLRNLVVDELPQSSSGRQIMTVEPKFVPNNTINITVEDELSVSVRLVDCVGYVIPNATGLETEEGERLVKTPWFEEEIPFKDAAEIGTQKVIQNHSTIGVVVTTDGSIGNFSREDYVEAEETVVAQLQELNKPFVVILNSTHPNAAETQRLKDELEEKYGCVVVPVSVVDMTNEDIDRILKHALHEFEINELNIQVPKWLSVLNDDNDYKKYLNNAISESTSNLRKFKDVYEIADRLTQFDYFKNVSVSRVEAGVGEAEITIDCDDNLYNEILEDIVGDTLNDKGEFIRMLQDYKNIKREFSNVEQALQMVKSTGYGIAVPRVEDMTLETPEVIKQGNRFGVKLKAIAPSIHMIKVDVESTFEPIIGSEQQSKDLINHLMEKSHEDIKTVWNSEIFGRKLSDVVNDGIRAKLYMLPDTAREKFKMTLEKVVNKGSGGIIAIIL